MKDIAGQDIMVGSKVAFGTRVGNSAKLQLGEVTEVNVSIYPGLPNRLGASVKSRGGRMTYKDANELAVVRA